VKSNEDPYVDVLMSAAFVARHKVRGQPKVRHLKANHTRKLDLAEAAAVYFRKYSQPKSPVHARRVDIRPLQRDVRVAAAVVNSRDHLRNSHQ